MKLIVFLIFSLCFFSSFSCDKRVKGKIKFDRTTNCKDGVEFINFDLKNDESIELSKFINSTRLDSKTCSYDTSIFQFKSFIPIILTLYSNKVELKEGSFDSREQFYDWRFDVLTNISNINILNEITDSLLSKNNGDGISALWNELNIKKLKNFNQYKSSANWLQLAELSVIFHSQGDLDLRDQFLSEIEKSNSINKEDLKLLKSIFSDYNFISREEFNELFIYGNNNE